MLAELSELEERFLELLDGGRSIPHERLIRTAEAVFSPPKPLV
jgi:hypothetical protein